MAALSLAVRVATPALGSLLVGGLVDGAGLSTRECAWVFTAFSAVVAVFFGGIYYPRFRRGIIAIPLGDVAPSAATATAAVAAAVPSKTPPVALAVIRVRDEDNDLIEQHVILPADVSPRAQVPLLARLSFEETASAAAVS